MSEMIRAETPRESPAPELQKQTDDTAPLKWQTTLQMLVQGPKHRFQAEGWGDHALHSTVSDLHRNHGLKFDREWCKVPTRFGKYCRVKRYWINLDSLQIALDILAGTLLKSRGAKP